MSGKFGALASAYVGRRVEIAPHLDAWMAGRRYGTIVRVTARGFRVRLDAPIARTGDRARCAKCDARIRYERAGRDYPPGWSHVAAPGGRLCDNGGLHAPAPAVGREITVTDSGVYAYLD